MLRQVLILVAVLLAGLVLQNADAKIFGWGTPTRVGTYTTLFELFTRSDFINEVKAYASFVPSSINSIEIAHVRVCHKYIVVVLDNGMVFYKGKKFDNAETWLKWQQMVFPTGETFITDVACTGQTALGGGPAIFAISYDGLVYAWGQNYLGRMAGFGDSALFVQLSPAKLTDSGMGFAIKVAPSQDITMVLFSSGQVRAWGLCGEWCFMASSADQNANIVSNQVITIAGESITDVSVFSTISTTLNTDPGFGAHAAYCTASGKAYTAGNTTSGALGTGLEIDSRMTPFLWTSNQIDLLQCRKAIAAYSATIFLFHDGTLFAAGKQTVSGAGAAVDPTVPSPIMDQLFKAHSIFVGYPDASTSPVFVRPLPFGTFAASYFSWGAHETSTLWLPTVAPSTNTPQVSRYLSEDFQLDPPTFIGSNLEFSYALTKSGSVYFWTGNLDQVPLATEYGITQPPKISNPTLADNRHIMSLDFDPIEAHDPNPSPNDRIAFRNATNHVVYYRPRSTSPIISVEPPTTGPVKQFVVFQLFSFSALVSADGSSAWYYYIDGSVSSPTSWQPLSAFAGIIIKKLLIVGPNPTDLYAPAAADLTQIGFIVLSADNKLYWHRGLPTALEGLKGAGEDGSAAHEIPWSRVFGADAPAQVVDIFGNIDSLWLRDQEMMFWTYGNNANFMLCHGDVGTMAPAKRLNSAAYISNITDVFDVVTLNKVDFPIVAPGTITGRSTILVSKFGIYACGNCPWNGNTLTFFLLNGSNSDPNKYSELWLTDDNYIVEASVGPISVVARTNTNRVYTFGPPTQAVLTDGAVWVDYTDKGALSGRTVNSVATVGSGGAIAISRLSITRTPQRKIILIGGQLNIFGTSFGGDGFTTLAYYTIDGTERLACDVNRRSKTVISCNPQNFLTENSVITASVVLYDSNTGAMEAVYDVPIGTISLMPYLTTTTRILAVSADKLVVSGNYLGAVARVSLSRGSCSSINVTNDSLTCFIVAPGGLPTGPLDLTFWTIEPNDSGTTYGQIARVVPTAVITSSASDIASGTKTLRIQGSNFGTVYSNQASSPSSMSPSPQFFPPLYNDDPNTEVYIRVGTTTTTCIPNFSTYTDTGFECTVTNASVLAGTSGTVYAKVRVYNGFSAEVVIGGLKSPDAIAGAAGFSLPGAIGGSVAGFVVLVIIVILIIYLVRVRRRIIRDAAGRTVEVPKEMASMFNIKSTDLEIVKKLGEGSFGAVFLCKWKGKMVALKKLTGSMMSSHVNDFFREAALMTGIAPHKNIVRIHGLCQEQNNFSLVMEFLRNGSLDGYMEKRVFVDPDSPNWDNYILYRIVLGIARGMAHLASQGIVHRDLAARNILLGSHCEPKISDFGMSRMVGSENNTGQTQSSIGPIKWMPPESLSDRLYSEKSDVWAYGVTLFEIVSGRPPYEGEDFLKIVFEVRDQGRNVLTNLDKKDLKKMPKYIVDIMESCFEVQPDDRPTFAEIVKRLEANAPFGYSEAPEGDEAESSSSSEKAPSKPSGESKYGNALTDEPSPSVQTNKTNKGNNKTNKTNKPAAAAKVEEPPAAPPSGNYTNTALIEAEMDVVNTPPPAYEPSSESSSSQSSNEESDS